MKIDKITKVKKYFYKSLRKVKAKDAWVSFPSDMIRLKGIGKFIPFHFGFIKNRVPYKIWLKQSLGVCYEHASCILLGLQKNDLVVIGIQDHNENAKFQHAWNEFQYKGKWYAYDYLIGKVMDRESYYKEVEPTTILTSYTLQDVLDDYKKFKTEGKKYDKINIPDNLPRNLSQSLSDDCEKIICKNICYRNAEITLDKNGNIHSALVSAAELD